MDININFNFPPTSEGVRLRASDVDEPITHPPIIITDGSASVAFSAEAYEPAAGENKFVSSGLFLHQIAIFNKETGASHTCYTVPANVRCKVEITCQRGGDTRIFTIVGANRTAGGSPTVEFDLGEFQGVSSGDVRYQKYANSDFRITRLRLFRVADDGAETPILHPPPPNSPRDPCPLVPGSGACEIRIIEKHVANP